MLNQIRNILSLPNSKRSLDAAKKRATARRFRGQNAIFDRGVATLITVVIIGLVIAYYYTNSNQTLQSNQELQDSAIIQEVGVMYGVDSTYLGLTAGQIAASGVMSPQWVVTGAGTPPVDTLISVYKSPITLAPVTNIVTTVPDGAYTMTLTGLPEAACIALATVDLGPDELGVTINSTTLPAAVGIGTSPAATPALAETGCQKGTAGADTIMYVLQ